MNTEIGFPPDFEARGCYVHIVTYLEASTFNARLEANGTLLTILIQCCNPRIVIWRPTCTPAGAERPLFVHPDQMSAMA